MEEIERITNECTPALEEIARQEATLREKLTNICTVMETQNIDWADIITHDDSLFHRLSKIFHRNII